MGLAGKKIFLRGAASMAVLVTAALGFDASYAQSEAAVDADAIDTTGDIVVTAQRRSESLQRVPIAVTAITPAAIENLSIRGVSDIENLTPGLSFRTGYGYAQTYIRGVGTQLPNPGLEGAVALYIDGAYLPRGMGAFFDLVDVESVQVLKGPQGTLYGRNASGGAVLLTSASPTDTLGGYARVEYGNFEHVLGQAALNLPVNDKLAFRFAASRLAEDGFITNRFDGTKLGDRKTYTLRGKMRWELTPDFSALVTAQYVRDVAGSGGARANPDAPPPILSADNQNGFYEVNNSDTKSYFTRDKSINVNLKYDSDQLSIQSITAYRNFDAQTSSDQDLSEVSFFFFDSYSGGDTFTQDLQISSKFQGAFNFLAGGQYVDDDAYFYANIRLGDPVNVPYVENFVRSKSYAVYAEAYIKPLDKLTLTLGGRYSKDKRRLAASLNAAARATFTGDPNQPDFNQQISFQKFTPRAVLAYDAGLVNVYGSYTRGFKAGGFTSPVFSAIPSVRPEVLDNFEIGAKFVSADRKVRLNVAAFHYIYKDVQVSIIDVERGGQITTNAARARGKGAEAELTLQPNRWLQFMAGGSYLDAKFRDYQDATIYFPDAGYTQGIADLSGTVLPRAPKWTAYASVNFEYPISDEMVGRFNAIARYSSSYLFYPAGGGPRNFDRQPSYTLVNISGSVGPSSDAFEIGFYIDNLTDRKYYNLRNTSNFGAGDYVAKPRTYGAGDYVAKPRTYCARMKIKFGS